MKKNTIFTAVLMILAVVSLGVVLMFSCRSMERLGDDYHALKNADLSKDTSGTIFYDDGLYLMTGYGIEILSSEENGAERLETFLEDSMRDLDGWVASTGITYTMIISSLTALWIYERCKEDRKKMMLHCFFSVLVIYFIFISAIVIMHKAFDVPFYVADMNGLLKLAEGILAVVAGLCTVVMIIGRIRFRKTAALLAIPLVIVLFMLSMFAEAGLYSKRYIDSFSYLADIDPRILDEEFDGELYYDEQKNVVILEGREYEPEQLENPDHVKGIKRMGCYLFELLNPYSGNSLYLYEHMDQNKVPIVVAACYILKATIWIILAGRLMKEEKA